MKILKPFLLGVAIAAALAMNQSAIADGNVTAGGNATAKGGASQLLYLRAPNNATPSVTIWTPKPTAAAKRETGTAKGGATKLIRLPAANGPTSSVTIWTGK